MTTSGSATWRAAGSSEHVSTWPAAEHSTGTADELEADRQSIGHRDDFVGPCVAGAEVVDGDGVVEVVTGDLDQAVVGLGDRQVERIIVVGHGAGGMLPERQGDAIVVGERQLGDVIGAADADQPVVGNSYLAEGVATRLDRVRFALRHVGAIDLQLEIRRHGLAAGIVVDDLGQGERRRLIRVGDRAGRVLPGNQVDGAALIQVGRAGAGDAGLCIARASGLADRVGTGRHGVRLALGGVDAVDLQLEVGRIQQTAPQVADVLDDGDRRRVEACW